MISNEMQQLLEFYNKGLELYKKQLWDEAGNFFQKALAIKDDDGPSKLYMERCKRYEIDPPAKDWDGVFIMTTK